MVRFAQQERSKCLVFESNAYQFEDIITLIDQEAVWCTLKTKELENKNNFFNVEFESVRLQVGWG